MSVSAPFLAPSRHCVATHSSVLALQNVLTQSGPVRQALPVAHFVAQAPAQSTSVSAPSLAPSRHWVATQSLVTVLQNVLVQSELATHFFPVAHLPQVLPPQSVSVSPPFI